ncbi:MAG: hypothetical protein WCR30_00650 [Clostridia bacterium]
MKEETYIEKLVNIYKATETKIIAAKTCGVDLSEEIYALNNFLRSLEKTIKQEKFFEKMQNEFKRPLTQKERQIAGKTYNKIFGE